MEFEENIYDLKEFDRNTKIYIPSSTQLENIILS